MTKKLISVCLLIASILASLYPVDVARAAYEDWMVPWSADISLVGTTYNNHSTFGTGEKFALDFSRSGGCELYAPCSGTIKRYVNGSTEYKTTSNMADYGNYIMFLPDGYTTNDSFSNCVIMAHFSSFTDEINNRVKSGDYRINKGEKLGYMGDTGKSSGTHLHFEIVVPKSRVTSVFGISTALKKNGSNYITTNSFKGGKTGNSVPSGGNSSGNGSAKGDVRILYAYSKQSTIASGDSAMIYAKTSSAVDKVAVINERGETAAGSSVPTTSKNGEREWDFAWRVQDIGKRNVKLRAYAGSQYVDYAFSLTVTGARVVTTPPSNLYTDGWIEAPSGTTLSGKVNISGWAVASLENSVEIYINNTYEGEATRKSRPDVLTATKNTGRDYSKTTPLPGFSFTWNTARYPNGSYTIKAMLRTAGNTLYTIDSKTVRVAN